MLRPATRGVSLPPVTRQALPARQAPQAAVQQAGGGVLITTPDELDRYMRGEATSGAGSVVTPETAMRVGTVFGCVRLISGAVATMPLHIKRRVDDRTREDASDTALWELMRRRPCRWLTPAQFRRMLQAHVLLRGNAYCLKVVSRGEVRELIPLHPDRVKKKQKDDLSIEYTYYRPNGGVTTFRQDEIFHLFGLTLDGVNGVTPITYARETIGLALAMEAHGALMFRNGARVSGVFSHPQQMGADAVATFRASLEDFRAGGEREGKTLVLEEGMKYEQMGLSAVDAQWIESRAASRLDIMMYYGVPPHMLGDTSKSTSWGTGIYEQKDGFVTFTLDDWLVMWEEAITLDLTRDRSLYARFNRNALVRGNIRDRWDAYTKALQWGVFSPNDVLAREDENPRPGGDIYYPPPNTAGGSDGGDGRNPPDPGDQR